MILRLRLVIPTFDNPATIAQVVEWCLTLTEFPVLVIDDGSAQPVERLLTSPTAVAARAAGRLHVDRFPSNAGKGVALQRAFARSLNEGFTHVLTLDGDGQHVVTEIPKLVALMRLHPWDLIIGNRALKGANVPEVSRFGRKFSNFWVKFQTDFPVKDSQSGFRVYPLFPLQMMRWHTRRFDFEIEVLIRLLWSGVHVHEAPVEVIYQPPGERVSHFDKLWDNVRISTLNTVLVAMSLLRSPVSPLRAAFGVGLGVLIGCSPFYGFHSLIAAGAALLFRQNFLLIWLGTQVSIPPLVPFIVWASLRLGDWILGPHVPGVGGVTGHWLVGGIPLGLALGLGFGAITWFFFRTARARKKTLWSGRTRGGKFGNGFLKFLTRHFGLRAPYALFRVIVPYFYLFAPRARRASNEYWRVVRPDLGGWARQRAVFRQLETFARTLIDRVFQGFRPDARQFEIGSQGLEHVLGPFNRKEGLILVGAHVGGWDLAGNLLRVGGFAGDFHPVRFEAQGLTLDSAMIQREPDFMKRVRVTASAASAPTFEVRAILEKGGTVGFLGDRPAGANVALVPFFGKLAAVDTTPYRFASLCRTPVVFTFGFKGEGRRYDFYAEPALRVEGPMQVEAAARAFARTLEAHLRNYPDQWFNFFPFFSKPPAPPEGMAEGAAPPRAQLQEELRT